MDSEFKKFEAWARKQESKKKNWQASLEGSEMMRKFKAKFNVDKHFPNTHCPVCTMRQLYKKTNNEEVDQYICKFCLSEMQLAIVWRPEKTKLDEVLAAKQKEVDPDKNDEDDESDLGDVEKEYLGEVINLGPRSI